MAVQLPPTTTPAPAATAKRSEAPLTARRRLLPERGLILHVPTGWTDSEEELSYDIGPNASVRFINESIPNGTNASAYTDAIVRQLKSTLGREPNVTRRPCKVSGRAAFEILLNTEFPNGSAGTLVFILTTRDDVGEAFVLAQTLSLIHI